MHDVYNDDQTFGLVENDLEESGEEEQKFRWEVRYTNTPVIFANSNRNDNLLTASDKLKGGKSLFPILDSLTNNILNFSNRAASFKAGVQSLLQRLLRIFLVGLLHLLHLPLGNSPGLLCVPLFERCTTLWLKSGLIELVVLTKGKEMWGNI